MERRFTRDDRQEIIDDYVARNGNFSAGGFLREVRASNGTHRAWAWFEWNDGRAAEEFRLHQSRLFVQGLRISFTVETIERKVSGVTVREAPALISPMDSRHDGGGYYAFDPTNIEHMAELRRQGATALENWLRRYGSAFELAGGKTKPFKDAVALLRPVEAGTKAA
ncbi:MAG: hypothetical protein H0T76_20270 [Nannocystis sp.]|nr:hypothetical protein [Nannocystis sp.]MBA3548825.1 hypothetical protein [Nannocystis sp.]